MVVLFLVFALATLPLRIVRGQETEYTIENEGSIQRLNYGVIFQAMTIPGQFGFYFPSGFREEAF